MGCCRSVLWPPFTFYTLNAQICTPIAKSARLSNVTNDFFFNA